MTDLHASGAGLNVYQPGGFSLYGELGLIASQLFEQEALARGLETERLHVEMVIASDAAGRSVGFDRNASDLNTYAAGVLTIDKQATRRLLQQAGLPVPEGQSFPANAHAQAHAYAGRIGFPVVVKPLAGARGEGVVAGIGNQEALAVALDALSATAYSDKPFIVEKHVAGGDYRVFATPDQVLSVVLRRPASVVGDGAARVDELVRDKNLLRRDNPHLCDKPILLDGDALRLLAQQGLDPASIPAAGRTVRLCSVASLSRGGDSVEVLEQTHPSVLEVAKRVVAAVPGLSSAGVDLLLPDHRQPLDGQQAGVCEVNSGANLALHMAPVAGAPRNLAGFLLRSAARTRGIELEDAPRQRLRLRSEVEGEVDVPAYIAWIAGWARALGLDGRVRVSGPRSLEVLVSGPTGPAVELVSGLMCGWRHGARPERVCTRAVEDVPGGGFHVAS